MHLRRAPTGSRPPAGRTAGRGFGRRWAAASALLFALGVLWGLSSPVPSGPDEAAQVIKAASTDQGTLIGAGVAHHPATTRVEVPTGILAALRSHRCHYRPTEPAGCPAHRTHLHGALSEATTYVGRYPPIYYAVVGLPSLAVGGSGAIRAMRIVDGLAVAALVGWAFALVTTSARPGLRTLALAVGITPTVLYLAGTVNPSGLEIAGAALLWSALVVALFDDAGPPSLPVTAGAVAGAAALAASRSLSPGFALLVVAAAVAVRPGAARRLLDHRRVRMAVAVGGAWAAACGAFVLAAYSYAVESFPVPGHPSLGTLALDVIGRTPRWVAGLVGGFGAPNFAAPLPVLLLWVGGSVAAVAAALLVAPRRQAAALAAVVAVLGFLLPFAIVISHARVDGLAWEGRYSAPLVIGLPLLAVGVVEQHRAPLAATTLARLAAAVPAVLAAGWLTASYWVLRRYTVGLRPDRPDAFATNIPGRWSPPLPAPLLAALVGVVTLLWATWLWRQARPMTGRGGAGGGGVGGAGVGVGEGRPDMGVEPKV